MIAKTFKPRPYWARGAFPNLKGDASRGIGLESFKAISLWQPWASAIALGLKKIETRNRPTFVEGRIAIHASLLLNKPGKQKLAELLRDFPISAAPLKQFLVDGDFVLPRGCVVALAEIEDSPCVEMLKTHLKQHPMESALGDYSAGRYGWILKNVQPLRKPFPCKGKQNWFKVNIPKDYLP